MNKEKFEVNDNIMERLSFIKRAESLFGKEKVLIAFSDAVTYVFETVEEAIVYGIYRFKEIFKDEITTSQILNIDSSNVCVNIHTNNGSWATIKTLSSYYYDKGEDDDIDPYELEAMLEGETIFTNSKKKLLLLKKELNRIRYDDVNSLKHIVSKYLDWKYMWFTYSYVNKNTLQVMLNIELEGSPIIKLLLKDTIINNVIRKEDVYEA